MNMCKQEEIRSWQDQQQADWNFNKKHKDPRREQLRAYRKGSQTVHFNKEIKEARQADYRRYRAQMKQLMRKERYELLRGYQRTSGWLTW